MAEEAEPVLVSDPVPVVGRRWRFVCRWFKMGFRPCLLSCLTYFLWFLSPPPLDWIQDSGTLLSSLAFALETRSAAPAEPFLQNSIWVDDYYQGDIYSAFEEANLHRHAFFYYYAPWDADSQMARDVVERVAHVFGENTDLYFAAVNCWNHQGDCFEDFGAGKKSVSPRVRANVQNQFPIFVFYPKDRKGIQYSGPISEHHILEFILNCQEPVSVVQNMENFHELRANSGGQTLVGYFPGLQSSKPTLNYLRFLKAAYDLLELDPFRTSVGRVGVVISHEVAYQLHLNPSQPVRYFMWNSTAAAYPNKTITSGDSLVQWTAARSSKLTAWIGTSGRKSQRLASYLNHGSGNSLILFTNRHHGKHYSPQLSLLREAAVEYHTCNNETRKLNSPMLAHMRYFSRTAPFELETELNRCLSDPWFTRNFCKPRSTDTKNKGTSSDNCACLLAQAGNRSLETGGLTGRFKNVDPSLYFKRRNPKAPHPLKDESVHNDLVSTNRLRCSLVANNPQICDVLRRDLSADEMYSNAEEGPNSRIEGLNCMDNRTLNFFSADVATQRALMKSMGLNEELSGKKDFEAVIVDAKMETVYVMDEKRLDRNSLQDFIYRFHHHTDTLKRLKRSKNHPDMIPNPEAESRDEGSNNQVYDSERLVSIEINSDSFTSRVLNSTQNVVLLYTTGSCGFCTGTAHTFHTVSHLLSPMLSPNLTFATIDAANNDLSWQFTALSVPSILFFPSDKKDETRAFPSSKALSVPNLVGFIIANLPWELRLQISIGLCDEDCLLRAQVEVGKRIANDAQSPDEDDQLVQLEDILRFEQLKREENQRAGAGQNPHHRRFEDSYPTMGDGSLHTEL